MVKSTDFKAVLIGADEETDLALCSQVDSSEPLPFSGLLAIPGYTQGSLANGLQSAIHFGS